jgi:hypothetical protein
VQHGLSTLKQASAMLKTLESMNECLLPANERSLQRPKLDTHAVYKAEWKCAKKGVTTKGR